ncbi:FAD-dependent oxidoreductase, partial [Planobispora rosea]|uniref:FAD-dependent oxidoreductase n=1 Tax=Planobispora rosea TaxID=35762 RepID=UPI00114CE9A6
LVLEARDRLGGRIRTAEIGGSDIDLGAAWIHDPRGNPLTRLCERAGIPRLPYTLDDLIAGVALVGEGGARVRSSLRSSLIRSAAGFEDAAVKLTAPGGAAGSGRETTLGVLIDADGAFTSGIREAKRLLGVPSVELRLQA